MIIYLISFLEALSGGLVGINTALYFKYSLGLSEGQSASIFSTMGILGSILILVLGRMVDRYGVKRTAIFGATTLILGRVGLYFTHSLNLALFLLVIMAIGSAVKGSSVLVYLRQQGKSFKLDYIIFNLAYCISGFIFDYIHNYPLTFLIAGFVTVFNLIVIMFLADNKPANLRIDNVESSKGYDSKVLKTVLTYNSIMLPVSGIFTFMAAFIPKWAIATIGPDAPVGKLYGSLNPFIILLTVPLVHFILSKRKPSPYNTAVVGTLLSAVSLFFIGLPVNWITAAIVVISLFTIGEAIWSPANMEVGTTLCPPGQEGRYLTISLIPRTLIGFFMSWAIAYEFSHFVYTPSPHYWVPFISMGLFALLTPIGLLAYKTKLLDTIK